MASSEGAKGSPREIFYVTKDSQKDLQAATKRQNYAGLRDLRDVGSIQEEDIVGKSGDVMGMKNRVRAGLAHFENPDAIIRKNAEENKIVVYSTSFRGVRATFEDCKCVLSLFHNMRVKTENRDIYLAKFYYRELEERLGESVQVPQVFISGQHIGGREKIEELNETGELRMLLDDFPKQEAVLGCPMCGGYQFVPCLKCGGSKNSFANNFTSEFRALKCTKCNENGMQPCPKCSVSAE